MFVRGQKFESVAESEDEEFDEDDDLQVKKNFILVETL